MDAVDIEKVPLAPKHLPDHMKVAGLAGDTIARIVQRGLAASVAEAEAAGGNHNDGSLAIAGPLITLSAIHFFVAHMDVETMVHDEEAFRKNFVAFANRVVDYVIAEIGNGTKVGDADRAAVLKRTMDRHA